MQSNSRESSVKYCRSLVISWSGFIYEPLRIYITCYIENIAQNFMMLHGPPCLLSREEVVPSLDVRFICSSQLKHWMMTSTAQVVLVLCSALLLFAVARTHQSVYTQHKIASDAQLQQLQKDSKFANRKAVQQKDVAYGKDASTVSFLGRCKHSDVDIRWQRSVGSSIYQTPLIFDLFSDGKKEVIVPTFVRYLEVLQGMLIDYARKKKLHNYTPLQGAMVQRLIQSSPIIDTTNTIMMICVQIKNRTVTISTKCNSGPFLILVFLLMQALCSMISTRTGNWKSCSFLELERSSFSSNLDQLWKNFPPVWCRSKYQRIGSSVWMRPKCKQAPILSPFNNQLQQQTLP